MIAHLTAVEVSISNLGVFFEDPAWVIRGMSFDVESGSSVAILGESGAGKSVLLRILAGLQMASEGSVCVSGAPVTAPQQSVGYVAQDYSRSLFPWLTISGNLRLALLKSGYSRGEINDRILQALNDVGLDKHGDKYPWESSGGMQQRASLARVLLGSPKVLLLDEPFGSLDTSVKWDLQDLIRHVCRERKITTVLVTHDIEEAIYMSDRILTIGSNPARVTWDTKVNLDEFRTQSITRVQPEFLSLREQLLKRAIDKFSATA